MGGKYQLFAPQTCQELLDVKGVELVVGDLPIRVRQEKRWDCIVRGRHLQWVMAIPVIEDLRRVFVEGSNDFGKEAQSKVCSFLFWFMIPRTHHNMMKIEGKTSVHFLHSFELRHPLPLLLPCEMMMKFLHSHWCLGWG